MADAMAYVLRQHDFRAGRFRVAYQSCDDAVAATRLPDSAKCAANARAYGRREDVLVVLGPLSSDCALAAIPELGRAAEPLAMVSPLASSTALTRATPGAPPGLPRSLYPGGERTFLRVFPTDGHQVAALALLAQRLARAPVFVLDDGEDEYGRVLAAQFERSARALGLPVAGRASWSAGARTQAPLAERVARSGARAVFLGGLLDTGGPAVVRALRERLEPDVALLAPDGFTPLPLLIRHAGRAAATGTFVSQTGIVDAGELGPTGQRFARELSGALGTRTVEPSAIYAAQAMEVALDAIARSDGTRSSVRAALFATDLRDGLIGPVRFDVNGDVSRSPVTILRVAPGTREGPVAPDAVVDRVLRVPANLVR
jgi:branched-chain amino acid transport system substrate-binding protein